MTGFLFVSTVLIWGTTWLAISMQIGPVPVVTSVFWRFAVAALVLMAWLAMTRRLRWPDRRNIGWLALQGLCIFGLNFVLIYTSEIFIAGGLVSVIFSLATLFNAMNARLFYGEKISPRMFLAALTGVAGLVAMFWRDVSATGLSGDTLRGICFAAAGTYCFSLGNMVSRRNSAAGLPVMVSNGWGMTFGALFLTIAVAVSGAPFAPPSDSRWLGAMIYLALIGSVGGFGAYLGLVARIGPARAAYCTVMFPAVALALSWAFEGYVWHWQAVMGLVLVSLGNAIVFARLPRWLRRPRPSFVLPAEQRAGG